MRDLLYLNVHLLKNQVMNTLKNPRQVIPALFMFVVFSFPLITFYSLDIPRITPPYTTETAKSAIFSFLTFITWITVIHSTTKNTLVFSLPEIDFLFPSPVKRRTILLNRISISYIKMSVQYLGVAAFLLFVFSIIYGIAFWPRILFLWTAVLLTLIFASNLGNIVSLVSSHLSELKRSRNKRIFIGAALIFVGVILGYIIKYIIEGIPPFEAVTNTLNSSFVRVLMYPMAAASDVAVTWRFTSITGLKILFLGILCAVTTWGVLSVETHFYEASEATSREMWESVRKIQRQEVVVSESFVKRMRKVNPFGRGATALVWKNLVGMIRDIRTLLPTVFMAILLFVIMVIRGGTSDFFSALFFLFFLVFITTGYVRWDFREDLRRIEIIKLIPDSSLKIVLSEIAVPTLFSTVLSYAFLVMTFAAFPGTSSKIILTGFSVVALPLFSLMMVTILNLSALYYPPQTENQIVPGILSMIFTFIVLIPSFFVGIIFFVMKRMYTGLVLVLVLNVAIAFVLLKLLERKYRIFDMTSS